MGRTHGIHKAAPATVEQAHGDTGELTKLCYRLVSLDGTGALTKLAYAEAHASDEQLHAKLDALLTSRVRELQTLASSLRRQVAPSSELTWDQARTAAALRVFRVG